MRQPRAISITAPTYTCTRFYSTTPAVSLGRPWVIETSLAVAIKLTLLLPASDPGIASYLQRRRLTQHVWQLYHTRRSSEASLSTSACHEDVQMRHKLYPAHLYVTRPLVTGRILIANMTAPRLCGPFAVLTGRAVVYVVPDIPVAAPVCLIATVASCVGVTHAVPVVFVIAHAVILHGDHGDHASLVSSFLMSAHTTARAHQEDLDDFFCQRDRRSSTPPCKA